LLLSLSLSRWPDDPVLPLGSVVNGEIVSYPPSLFHGGRTVDGGDDRRPHSPFLFHGVGSFSELGGMKASGGTE
ncbi:hypothetical protein LINGRAHAP2_LOCUS7359, partial [Linum grandiflorum]